MLKERDSKALLIDRVMFVISKLLFVKRFCTSNYLSKVFNPT
jgi:hypothetical protein